ncbi:MAG TPA: carboxypeptidase-like regulatory domain-containing protein, partial [Chitinophagaceae bacterium]|nr:carboxypeptidase-like regulatory domain-containing protein [Chitinophagaceae bacterium]
MRKSIRFIAAILLMTLFLPPDLYAQEKTITGTVLSADARTPLMGVNVSVKNTLTATQTDADGKFQITAAVGQVLQFSSVGFATQEVTVGADNSISISLVQQQETLSDVVVVGYGTQRRTNLTGAVSTVDVKKTLAGRPIADVGRGLQGAASGL